MRQLPPELSKAWNRWFRIVEDVAAGRPVPARLSGEGYVKRHQQLLKLCDKYGVSRAGRVAIVARDMAGFAEHWTSLEMLFQLDDAHLKDLICTGRARFGRSMLLPGNLLVVQLGQLVWYGVALCVMVGAFLYIYDRTIIESALRELRNLWFMSTRFVRLNRGSFYIAAILVVVLAGQLLYSTKKS